jgi:hypothetical protein
VMKFVLTVFVGVMITGHSLFAMCEEGQNEGMTVRKIQEATENKKKDCKLDQGKNHRFTAAEYHDIF